MRTALWIVLAAALFAACSGPAEEPATVCQAYDQIDCTCPNGVPGSRTCFSDGSGYGECDALGCNCGTGTAHRCCMNDSYDCCPCVDVECSYANRDILLECLCQEGVCAAECEVECAGEGFSTGQTCESCVDMAAQSTCKAQNDACK